MFVGFFNTIILGYEFCSLLKNQHRWCIG